MRTLARGVCFISLFIIVLCSPTTGQTPEGAITSDMKVLTIKPQYVPPGELLSILGAGGYGNRYALDWRTDEIRHIVEIRPNDAANLLILSGTSADVEHAAALIRAADIAPRQIEIEVKIIEISTGKARRVGLDWEYLFSRTQIRGSQVYNENTAVAKDVDRGLRAEDWNMRRTDNFEATSQLTLSDFINILDTSGVGKTRTVPKILTLNNRRATILDGKRITYVAKYGVYTGLYETDTMDAGLTMNVTPSLAESGYITLHINAELTLLGKDAGGSLLKDGQMLENTVVVKNGESALLGGMTQEVTMKSKKRFPLLGHVLPFLFSKEVEVHENIQSFMILTPRVVDFATAVTDSVTTAVENK